MIEFDDMWSEMIELQERQFEEELVDAYMQFNDNAPDYSEARRAALMINDAIKFIELLWGKDD